MDPIPSLWINDNLSTVLTATVANDVRSQVKKNIGSKLTCFHDPPVLDRRLCLKSTAVGGDNSLVCSALVLSADVSLWET